MCQRHSANYQDIPNKMHHWFEHFLSDNLDDRHVHDYDLCSLCEGHGVHLWQWPGTFIDGNIDSVVFSVST